MPKRTNAPKWPPKGSYPHPHGGHITPTTRHNRIRVTGHLKAQPDLKAIALAAIELAKHLDKTKS